MSRPDLTDAMIDKAVALAKHFLSPDYGPPSAFCERAGIEHANVVREQSAVRRLTSHNTVMLTTLVRAARNGGVPSKPAGKRVTVPSPWRPISIPVNSTTKQLAVAAAILYVVLRVHGVDPAVWVKDHAPAATNAVPTAAQSNHVSNPPS